MGDKPVIGNPQGADNRVIDPFAGAPITVSTPKKPVSLRRKAEAVAKPVVKQEPPEPEHTPDQGVHSVELYEEDVVKNVDYTVPAKLDPVRSPNPAEIMRPSTTLKPGEIETKNPVRTVDLDVGIKLEKPKAAGPSQLEEVPIRATPPGSIVLPDTPIVRGAAYEQDPNEPLDNTEPSYILEGPPVKIGSQPNPNDPEPPEPGTLIQERTYIHAGPGKGGGTPPGEFEPGGRLNPSGGNTGPGEPDPGGGTGSTTPTPRPGPRRRIRDIEDGTANTLMQDKIEVLTDRIDLAHITDGTPWIRTLTEAPDRFYIQEVATGKMVVAQFNPTEVADNVEVDYTRLDPPGASYQHMHYNSTKNYTVDLELYWTVQTVTEQLVARQCRALLWSWCYPNRVSDKAAGGISIGPPILLAVWPDLFAIKCRLLGMSMNYLRFSVTGAPTRWVASVKLEECRDAFLTSEDVQMSAGSDWYLGRVGKAAGDLA